MLDDGYKTLPADVKELNDALTEFEITLFEGKNRQIRKMLKSIGFEIVELSRIMIGNIGLKGLRVGEWRYMSESEVKNLKNL